MTNLNILQASYSIVAWSVEIELPSNGSWYNPRHKISWNTGEPLRISSEGTDGKYGNLRNTTREEILSLLPENENWTWNQFLSAIYFFSEGMRSERIKEINRKRNNGKIDCKTT